MEKLIYLLWKPEVIAEPQWHSTLVGDLVARLHATGARQLRLNLPDEHVKEADPMRMTHQPPLPDAMLSFWIDSAFHRHPAEQHMLATATRIAGYSVCESEPLPNTLHPPAHGQRCFGMSHIVFLQTPEQLSREAWMAAWLENHTAIAIDTQQTFAYRQNIVVRRLTQDAPRLDAIVEESFPPAAIHDQNAFYRQDSPETLQENQKRMYQSCKQFIDFGKMGRLPTSEYNFQ